MWEIIGLLFFILLGFGLRKIYLIQKKKGHQAFEAVHGRPPQEAEKSKRT